MKHFDYAVIGGGIVGLATAWALVARYPGARVVVVEKERDVAQHQTGRNSGVIHSGIYYRPGSTKARLCREGNGGMVRFCAEHGIAFEVCGKIIVATEERERPALKRLSENGKANGLAVRELAAEEVRELEPNVQGIAGLHVPSTGIVSYSAVCRELVELIRGQEAELLTGVRVTGLVDEALGSVVETTSGEFHASWIVNCAGLFSDRIARLAGASPEARIVPFRGEYYELREDRRHLVRNLIYPVPDPQLPFLGVHFTRMIDGSVHAGPNAVLSLKREGYDRLSFNLRDFAETITYSGFWRMVRVHARSGCDEMIRSFSKRAFVRSLQRLIPDVVEEDLIPSAAGVRAQALRPDGRLVDDFLIIPGRRATHVCNAPSPAATSSLEIGSLIADEVPDVTAPTISNALL